MARALLVNTSAMPRRAWAVVPFGRRAVAQFGTECTFVARDGSEHRAVGCGDRGHTSTIYRIRASFMDQPTLAGELVDRPHADAKPEITRHRWAVDDVNALIPQLQVMTGGQVERSGIRQAKRLAVSPAHERWVVTSRTPTNSFWLHWWVDLRHDDPVCSVHGIVRWSNRQDVSWDRYVEHVMLACGEYVAVANARLLGVRQPFRLGREWIIPLANQLSFSDGSGLAFSGEMPTFRSDYGEVDEIEDMQDRADMDDLRAAMHGPVVGIGEGLSEDWLASGFVASLPAGELARLSDEAIARFAGLGERGWYATRTYGCLPSPSATGSQPDFGATKGSLGLHDPRHLAEFLWSSYAEAHRGLLHLESNGEPVRASDHPNWVTWSGRTHSTGSDTLGKRRPGWTDGKSTGWSPHDDEHLSLNMLAACAALSDDPVIDTLIEHQIETSLASSRHRTGHPDAARAQGRCAQAFAMLASAYSDSMGLLKLDTLERRRWEIARNSLAANSPPGSRMRCIATITDPRKPIRDDLGQLMPVVSLWEHGLATVGFYVAELRRVRAGLPLQGDELLRELARLMLRYGVTAQGDLVADAAWFGGADHPIGYDSGSRYVILAAGSGVGNWTLAGMVAAVAILARQNPIGEDLVLVERGRRLLPPRAHDLTEAEWFATVRDVAVAGLDTRSLDLD